MAGIGAALLASCIAVVDLIGYVSSGCYFLIFRGRPGEAGNLQIPSQWNPVRLNEQTTPR
jgi:hypothetical protein